MALAGFVLGVILTKAFGVAGFIALLVLFFIGIPLFAVISVRRSARPSSKQSAP